MTENPETRPRSASELLESMVARVENLATEAQLLRQEISAVDKRRKTDRNQNIALFVIIVLLLLFLAVTQVQARHRAADARSTLEYLIDCTDYETGKCAQENLRRSNELIAQLIEENRNLAIWVAQCERHAKSDNDLEECVRERIQEESAKQ